MRKAFEINIKETFYPYKTIFVLKKNYLQECGTQKPIIKNNL